MNEIMSAEAGSGSAGKKLISLSITAIGLLVAASVSAHVVVKPNQVGIGQRQNFAVSVPTEEADPTVQIRLVIPEGVQSVRPNTKAGWNIQLVKAGEGDSLRVAEIIWSGGRIPAEQRDEFVFSAQAPSEEKTLVWKAYQTYGNGNVVAWEIDPQAVAEYAKNNPPKEGEDDHNAPRPWSETAVIDDLSASNEETKNDNLSLILSVIAIVLSGYAILHKKNA